MAHAVPPHRPYFPFHPQRSAAMDCLCCFSPPRLLPPPVTPRPPKPFLPSSPQLPSGTRWKASRGSRIGVVSASAGGTRRGRSPALDDKPHLVLEGGEKVYLDEQDVVSFLDPPKELIPINPSSYNPAAYLWKKIGDIPEERRHRLLSLVKDRLISCVWQLTETRYLDAKLAKKSSSSLLSLRSNPMAPEIWNCRTSSGPLPFSWLNAFQKVIFRSRNGGTYGRIVIGGSFLSAVAGSFYPLYFTVREANEVMPTEQPCDLAYEFGTGLLDLPEYPDKFPKPVKHPWPFNDQIVIYIRHAGPGVLVGQAWQEGKELEQVPKKFCGEILMVKAYDARLADM